MTGDRLARQRAAALRVIKREPVKMEAPTEWLDFNAAVQEIKDAFNISTDTADMTLCGLFATAEIICRNKQGEIIEPGECPIGEFWSGMEKERMGPEDHSPGPQMIRANEAGVGVVVGVLIVPSHQPLPGGQPRTQRGASG